MTAIILLSLPEDAARVGHVLDALIGERLDAVWHSAVPGTAEWDKAAADALAARCLLLCWSDPTRSEAAAPFRQLAAAGLAKGIAIGIELDQGAVPPDLTGMSVYSLAGWRAHRRGLWRAFAGRIFYNDIVAAAKFKAAGKDPPSASAPAKMVARQAWVLAVGLGAVLGILALPKAVYDTIPWPRWNEERAWTAIPNGSCPGLAAFVRAWPDGRHAGEARDLYTARTRTAPKWTAVERSAPFFVLAGDAAPSPTVEAARGAALARAETKAGEVCQGFAEAAGSRVKRATAKPDDWICSPARRGTTCALGGTAQCALEELVDPGTETCTIPGR